MAATDMSILKIYIKMHSTSFFFSHLKKIKHVTAESVVKKSCISITNVLFYAMCYNDANKTPPTPLPYASFPEC